MVFPIHLTRGRLAIALCLGLAPSSPWAAAADWNCSRGKDDKQWVCSTKKAPAEGAESAPSEAPGEPAAARPIEPAPREIARPAEPAPAEPDAPAVSETPVRREPPAQARSRPPSSPRAAPPAQAETPARPETPTPTEAPVEPEAPAATEAPRRPEPPARVEALPRYEAPTPVEPETPAATVAPSQPEAPVQVEAPAEPEAPAPATPRQSAPRRVPPPTAAAPAAPSALKRIPETIRAQPTAPQTAAAKPRKYGWSCSPGEGDESGKGWDCSLEGPDPRGMAHVVDEADGQTENWAEATTITREDEQRFHRMAGMLPIDPWKNACAGRPQLTPLSEFILTPQDKLARKKAPLDIHSNYFELLDNEVANFSGGVEMVQADQKLSADFVTRDLVTNAFNTHGNVFFQQKGLTLSSDTGFMDSDSDRGVFRNSQFIFATAPGRGTSRLTHLDSSTLSRYETVTYTTCPPGNQDWLLHASTLKVNKESGKAVARDTWFEFKDVPIFYTPYMSFPTDQRRQTGLLSPSIGYNRYTGLDFSTPVYFNLAPNYDYTLIPRYYTNRGIQLKNEFRYLTDASRGLFQVDVVPHDSLTGTTRGQAAVLNDTRFSENLVGHVNAAYVSDYSYLNQLGNTMYINNRSNVPSVGYLSYNGGNGFWGRAQIDYFETIDPTIPPNARPYFHLPDILVGYYNNLADTGLLFDSQIQMDGFQNSGTNVTTGQRLKLRPKISYPIQSAAGYITPSFTLQHNQYWLQNPEYWSQTNNTDAQNTASFTIPITSIDSGAFFERDTELGDTPMTQTFEPRLFYVYIPYEKQNDVPVFDSSAYDFTYYQLFRENRFTGSDRVGDTNQLTLGISSRLIDQTTGRDRLTAGLGSAHYFSSRQVTLLGPTSLYPYQSQNNSNLIADFSAGITENWTLRTGGQWNPSSNEIDRGLVALQYNDRQNNLLNVAYRYRRNQASLTCLPSVLMTNTATPVPFINPYPCLDLTDVSLRMPLTRGWHVLGRWQYSLVDNLTLSTFAGFQRETCCWRFSLVGYRWTGNAQILSGQSQSSVTDTQATYGVYFQLELKGLTSLGDTIDDFLKYQISGYRLPQDLPPTNY